MTREYVEEICAEVLKDVEEKRISIRGAIEDRKENPLIRKLRSLILALCLETVRRYVLLDKIWEHVVGEVPRDSYRRNLIRIVTYEAKYRNVEARRLLRVCMRNNIKVSKEHIRRLRDISENDIVRGLSYEEKLHVKYSIPLWLVKYVLDKFPDGERILESFSQKLPTYARCRIDRRQVLKRLAEIGISAEEDPDLDDAIVLERARLSLIEKTLGNSIYIQDKSSMLVAHVVEKTVNNNNVGIIKIVDTCSAPGGKAIHVVDRLRRCIIIGIDISYRRLLTERYLIYKYDVHHRIDISCSSALRLPLRSLNPDIVIVDPDCTSIGKLSHSPEIRLWLRQHHVHDMARLQYKILKNVIENLRGRFHIVYSTCTITFEENEENISKICDEYGLEIVDLCSIFPKFCNIYMRGSLRLFPHLHRTGGYFISCVRR
ncbi:MAG: hypothetical protein GXO10_00610 [Crenarchaeota archaeon]|nr:hypothetical protein [Thermoproteota archaeon]